MHLPRSLFTAVTSHFFSNFSSLAPQPSIHVSPHKCADARQWSISLRVHDESMTCPQIIDDLSLICQYEKRALSHYASEIRDLWAHSAAVFKPCVTPGNIASTFRSEHTTYAGWGGGVQSHPYGCDCTPPPPSYDKVFLLIQSFSHSSHSLFLRFFVVLLLTYFSAFPTFCFVFLQGYCHYYVFSLLIELLAYRFQH